MKAQVTWESLDTEMDTISIFDNDNREIVIRRHQIPKLIKLLKAMKDRKFGELGLEIL